MNKICLYCNKKFEGYKTRKFCSLSCVTSNTNKNRKGTYHLSENQKKKISNSLKKSGANRGEKSWLYNTTLYDFWIKKYGIDEANKRQNDMKNKMSIATSGNKHPMFGTNQYNVWIKKYGIKEAEKRKKQHRQKLSVARIKYMKENNIYVSKSETLFLDRLEQIFNIKIERQFSITNNLNCFLYDGLVINTNILIESDGEYFHKNKQKDFEKEQCAIQNGYVLYRFAINSVKEVETKILEYKQILNKIFIK